MDNRKKVGWMRRKITISPDNILSKEGEPRNTVSRSLKADFVMWFTAASE
jgi:hypothetical protein